MANHWSLGTGWATHVLTEVALATRDGASARGDSLRTAEQPTTSADVDALVDSIVLRLAAERGVTVEPAGSGEALAVDAEAVAAVTGGITDALVDSAALHVFIPQYVCDQLQLEQLGERELLLANGARRVVPYVGPLEVRFKNRAGFMGAIVLGDQVVVGSIAMEDMDLVILPLTRELEVNPRSPRIARSIATTAPGASEPPGRYVLRRASRGRRSSSECRSR